MPCWNNQPWWRDSNQTASGKPGAVQIQIPRRSLDLACRSLAACLLGVTFPLLLITQSHAAPIPTLAFGGYTSASACDSTVPGACDSMQNSSTDLSYDPQSAAAQGGVLDAEGQVIRADSTPMLQADAQVFMANDLTSPYYLDGEGYVQASLNYAFYVPTADPAGYQFDIHPSWSVNTGIDPNEANSVSVYFELQGIGVSCPPSASSCLPTHDIWQYDPTNAPNTIGQSVDASTTYLLTDNTMYALEFEISVDMFGSYYSDSPSAFSSLSFGEASIYASITPLGGGTTANYLVTPGVATTPLPPSFGFFVAGISGLGLLGWGAKRKTKALAA